jgi:hypothetical protein
LLSEDVKVKTKKNIIFPGMFESKGLIKMLGVKSEDVTGG